MRKILITAFITIICLFLLTKHNDFKRQIDSSELKTFDIYLDSQVGNTNLKLIQNNYESAFKTSLKKLGYSNIDVNVNFVSTTQAMYNVSHYPYSIAFVDGTKYICNEQYANREYQTESLFNLTHFQSDANGNLLQNKTSEYDEFYFLTKSSNSLEYNSKDASEIVKYLEVNHKKIGLSSDEYDAAKIWFYYICFELNLDISKLNIKYYNSYSEQLSALENNEIDIMPSTMPKYLNKNLSDNDFTYIDNHFFDVYPLSKFVIYNPTSGEFFKHNLIAIFKNIFTDSKTQAQIGSAYGIANYENFKGFSSYEQTKTYNKYLKTYHNYILKEEQK